MKGGVLLHHVRGYRFIWLGLDLSLDHSILYSAAPVKQRNLRIEEHVGAAGPPKGLCPPLDDDLHEAVVGMQVCAAQSPVSCDRAATIDSSSGLMRWPMVSGLA